MQLGVVSDTHGNKRNTLDAIRMLESLEVECVIHCGDIGSAEIIPLFSAWPTHFVFGNVDRDHDALENEIQRAGQSCHGRFGSLVLEDVPIAFLHGDDERRFRETVASPKWKLVCYGHTHRQEHHWDGETLVLNPGAVHRASPHSLALVQLPQLEVTSIPF